MYIVGNKTNVFFLSGILLYLLMNLACTDEAPLKVQAVPQGGIAGLIKPAEAYAMIIISQGIPIDTTFADSVSGYFKTDSLVAGFYTLTVQARANRYGKYIMQQVQVISDGVTSVGDIHLKPVPEQINAVIPADGSENVPLNDPCKIQFSIPMNHISIKDNFKISPALDGYLQWQDEYTVLFNHYLNFKPNTTYTITLNTKAKTLLGDTLAFQVSSRFLTEGVKVISNSPVDGESYVKPSSTIYIEFNSPMNKSYVQAYFRVKASTTEILGSYTWHSSQAFSYKPGVLLPTNTRYDISLTTSARDIYDNSLTAPFNISFTTEPLTAMESFPQNGATNLPTTTTVRIKFNSEMDQLTTANAFTIVPIVVGNFTWLNFAEFIFTPNAALEKNTQYSVTLNTTCKNKTGENLGSSYFINFRTGD
jgi:hypothetical protein